MSIVALQPCHDLKGTVRSVEDLEMLDVGSGNVALKESARASVAQADRFLIAEAERGQHEGQHGEDLDTHGRSRRRADGGLTHWGHCSGE